MPFSLLNFGDSHQALAGMVITMAWSTMLAYSVSAGYITSIGGCAYQSNIVWLGQCVGLVSVELMLCWGFLASLLIGSGCFNWSVRKRRMHDFGELEQVLIIFPQSLLAIKT